MFFAGSNRVELRRRYYAAWQRRRDGLPLEALDAAIADVIAMHPEYHALFETPDALQDAFSVEQGRTNPFLHMGLHLGLREQLATKRPPGIDGIHARLAGKRASVHDAEHAMIEVLATVLWEAQRAGRAPDEQDYLARLQRLL